MNKEKMKFWVCCPHCKKKFGVTPEVVFKYADRLFTQLDQAVAKAVREAEQKIAASRNPEPPVNLPVAD